MQERSSCGSESGRRYIRQGPFVAEIIPEDNLFRFVIRDESRTCPSIHGSKQTMQETESAILTVLDRLSAAERAA